MIGQLISKYVVKDSSTGEDYRYKTIGGANRMYDKLDSIKSERTGASTHNVAIYQETDCVNELIAIKSNWFPIAE